MTTQEKQRIDGEKIVNLIATLSLRICIVGLKPKL